VFGHAGGGRRRRTPGDPLDVAELAHALTRLAADPALRDDLIARGRSRALQFTWDSAVARTWAVYEKVMAASS